MIDGTEGIAGDEAFLRRAIELAQQSVVEGGGPFGAVVVLDGAVIAEGRNSVVPGHDPTAHAEVAALRAAATALDTHVLSDCVLYASAEPCPMCASAAHWARVQRVVYAAGREDAAAAGFDDALLFEELARPSAERRVPAEQALREEGVSVFDAWSAKADRVEY